MQNPNAQGIMGALATGQRQRQPAPSPNSASPMAGLGSVEDRVAAYRGNPAPLQQRYELSQDLLDLLALQKIKSEKDAAARQIQMQMAQHQAVEGGETVAQQREREVAQLVGGVAQQDGQQKQARLNQLLSGIAQAPGAATAAQPQAMAAGGIVGYSGPEGSLVDAAMARVRSAENAIRQFGIAQRQSPEYSAAQQNLNAARDALKAAQAQMGRGEIPPAMFSPSQIIRGAQGPAPSSGVASLPRVATPPTALQSQYDAQDMQEGRGQPAPAAGIANLPAAPTPPRPAPTASRPAAPTASAASAPATAAPATPTMPTAPEIPAAPDPEATRIQRKSEFETAIALTPEERRMREEGIGALQKQLQQRYDPERMRTQGLVDFLIGAGGRRYNVLGSAEAAAQEGDRRRMAEMDALRERIRTIGEQGIAERRAGVKEAFAAGERGEATAASREAANTNARLNVFGKQHEAALAALDRDLRQRLSDAANRTQIQVATIRERSEAESRALQRELNNDAKTADREARLMQAAATTAARISTSYSEYLSEIRRDLALARQAQNKQKITQLENLLAETTRARDTEIRESDARYRAGITGGVDLGSIRPAQ